jgi:ferredoxin
VDAVASFFLLIVGSLVAIALLAFAAVSLREGERRATRIAVGLAVLLSIPIIVVGFLPPPVPLIGAAAVSIALFGLVAAWFAPIARAPELGGRPNRRVDERDIMFARGRLAPGSPEYEIYYATRPENKTADDHTRSLPGLLSDDAELAEELEFAAADACFDLTEAVRHHVNGGVADRRVERSPELWSTTIRDLALSLGALDVGVTELRPYHVYTHIGRGTGTYGDPIEIDHQWAIAFSVEMDHRRVSHAPAAPVVAESARQYVEGAKIALILASWIRRLGYEARAHIDGNYRVIAPLVARDAGLGEIGRMGLLMTPRLGPRVRLGVVTTALPLVADPPGDTASVIDFCLACQKCAVNCPVSAIPSGDRTAVDGGLRWAIDSDICFRYWNVVGTDCATCMRVCPYSHPDSAAHNLVRKAIRSSAAARRAMLWLDDVFYGRRPAAIDKIERRTRSERRREARDE